jgi:glutamate/tyrosine decarboxylase-like PLP-dependent enzyme
MAIPQQGRGHQEIMAQLETFKANDLPWVEGRVFSYIYDAGEEAMALLKDAYSLFMSENGLDPTSFPSCLELERDVIAMALDLVHAQPGAKGSFTSGGTESILLSVKTARDHARANRPNISQPELLLPETAHAAFYKACAYFKVTPVTVTVDPESFIAVPAAMEAAITANTIMMVGSAPSYAHGVIDPISELAAIAKHHGLLMHVDCCVGGMYLPFAKQLVYEIPPFDLSVDGVTQLSMDFHKWGYAAKGASAILYKDGNMRRHQIFSWSGWTGYTVINPTVMSTKGGGSVAACWAIMNHLGVDGYLDLVERSQAASTRIKQAISEIEGVKEDSDEAPYQTVFSHCHDTGRGCPLPGQSTP